MPIFASNFASNSLSGSFATADGFANVNLTTLPYALEGNKSFVIKIRRGSISGDVLATTSPITILDNSSVVSITANVSSVAEGNLVSFSVVTANAANNSNVFFSVFPVTSNVTVDDFVANTGSFTIINNAATFVLRANADTSLMDETGETFKVQIRTNSVTGNAVYTSSNVVILDTYKIYNILGVTAGTASPIISGDSVTFTFSAFNVPNGTLFYYSTTGNVSSFTSNTGSFALNSVSNTFVISNPQVTVNSIYNVVVRTDSQSGNIVATSNTMVVTPPPPRYLWTWGNNGYGQLGLGTSGTNYSSPKQVGALTTWLSVAAGYIHGAAIKNDGSLWTWGDARLGRLGHGNLTSRSSPVQVGALTNWSKITAGVSNIAAIKADGTLWTWGGNSAGQLGLNDTTNRSSPVQVGAYTDWASVSASQYLHMAAIKTNGTLWTWGGYAGTGNLGLGDTNDRSSPTQVGALTTWSSVEAAGSHTTAIKTDGTLWTWGLNQYGSLGLNNETTYSSPKQIGALTNWSSISVYYYHTVAIKTDGTLWSWGYGGQGRLGLGNTTNYSSPKQVGALTTWSKVSASNDHALGIKTDGTLWVWGWGDSGRLGLGDTTNKVSPTQVGTLSNWLSIGRGGQNWTATIAGEPKSLTVQSLIAGTASPIYTGTDVTFTVSVTDHTLGTLLYYSTTGNVTSFTANTGSFALNGASNTFIISAPQSAGSYNVVVKTGSQSGTVVATSNTMVVTPPPPQYLWSWGRNHQGQLGIGDTTDRSSPVQVGALGTWSTGSAGTYTSSAIKTDGTLWTWGKNYNGSLGLGDTNGRSSPVQVGALTTWSIVTNGSMFGVAIKTDGSLWSWGRNDYGMLGLGNTTVYSSPKQVGALTNWLSIAAGHYHVLGIKTNGTLWSWGRGQLGALGLGDTTDVSSPTQIGALTTWTIAKGGSYHSAAIKTDGTLWTWGRNYFGNLGQGNTTDRSSPVQVGALTTWSSVFSGSNFNLAIKTDGALWSWGHNNAGQLGLNDATNRSSPVQIGALTNWSTASTKFCAHQSHATAIKTDGTLWSWGSNGQGRLGLGDTDNRSSPVQIGALTNWLKVAGGHYSTHAISN